MKVPYRTVSCCLKSIVQGKLKFDTSRKINKANVCFSVNIGVEAALYLGKLGGRLRPRAHRGLTGHLTTKQQINKLVCATFINLSLKALIK